MKPLDGKKEDVVLLSLTNSFRCVVTHIYMPCNQQQQQKKPQTIYFCRTYMKIWVCLLTWCIQIIWHLLSSPLRGAWILLNTLFEHTTAPIVVFSFPCSQGHFYMPLPLLLKGKAYAWFTHPDAVFSAIPTVAWGAWGRAYGGCYLNRQQMCPYGCDVPQDVSGSLKFIKGSSSASC